MDGNIYVKTKSYFLNSGYKHSELIPILSVTLKIFHYDSHYDGHYIILSKK